MKTKSILLFISLFLFSTLLLGCEPEQDKEVIDEATEDVTTPSDIDLVREAFAEKYDRSIEDIEVDVDMGRERHMRGNIRIGEGPGSAGLFLAAKPDLKWVIVHDGQGVFTCDDVAVYNFPEDMISDCYSE